MALSSGAVVGASCRVPSGALEGELESVEAALDGWSALVEAGVDQVVPEGCVVEAAVEQDGEGWMVAAEAVDDGPGARKAKGRAEGEGGRRGR